MENAYVQHRSLSQQQQWLTQAEAAAQRSAVETEALFQRGAADRLGVLDAHHTEFLIRDQRVNADTCTAVAMVSLYRAFGGGWLDDRRPPELAGVE